jgi:hypothetical protein
MLLAALTIPIAAFVVSSLMAVITLRRSVSPSVAASGLALAAIALFVSVVAAALAGLFAAQSEGAVPLLLYGSLGLVLLVPLAAAINVGVMFVFLRRRAGAASNAA